MDFEECYCWNNCVRVLWWMCILCDWSSAGFLPQDAENKAMLICNLECSSFSERKKRPFRGSSFSPSLSLSLSLSLRSRRQSLCCGFTAAKFKWWTVKSGTEDTIAKSHFFGTGSRPSCMFLTLLLLFINTPLHIHAHLKKKKKKDTHMWASDMQRNTPARSHITAREMKKPGREDSGISVPAYYSNIHICPKLFILALHAVVLMRVCIMTLIHQNLPFVCPVFICVCVCDLVLHTSPLPN